MADRCKHAYLKDQCPVLDCKHCKYHLDFQFKPCPFCGAKNLVEVGDALLDMFWMHCVKCDAHGPSYHNLETAKELWNRRPTAWGKDPSGRWA